MKVYNKLSELPDYIDLGTRLLESQGYAIVSMDEWKMEQTRKIVEKVKANNFDWGDFDLVLRAIKDHWKPDMSQETGHRLDFNIDEEYVFTDAYGHYYSLYDTQLPKLIESKTCDWEIAKFINDNECEYNNRKIFCTKENGRESWFDSDSIENEAEAYNFAICFAFGVNPNTLDYDDGFDYYFDANGNCYNVSEEDKFNGEEVEFGDYILYVKDVTKYNYYTIDRSHLNEVMDKALSNYKVAYGELKGLPVEIAMFSSFRNWQDYKENEHDVRVDDDEIPADSEIHNSIFEYYDYLMESDEGLDEFIEELAEKIDAVVYTEYDNIYIYKNK